ncbi:hypothetical protein J6590_038863 [Homalodisca vitripennis]|nr:hypothetical protein J6590_038863 [Homalodisca vitripennis]
MGFWRRAASPSRDYKVNAVRSEQRQRRMQRERLWTNTIGAADRRSLDCSVASTINKPLDRSSRGPRYPLITREEDRFSAERVVSCNVFQRPKLIPGISAVSYNANQHPRLILADSTVSSNAFQHPRPTQLISTVSAVSCNATQHPRPISTVSAVSCNASQHPRPISTVSAVSCNATQHPRPISANSRGLL